MEIDYAASREDLRCQAPEETLRFICGLLKIFTQSLNFLHSFQLSECVRVLARLPQHHQDTAWVHSTKARAFFEDHNYMAAERVYRRLGELQPYRMEGMDIYSTTLWHLKRPVQLSHLAYRLISANSSSPSLSSHSSSSAADGTNISALNQQTQLQTLSLKAIDESGCCKHPQLYVILGNAFNLQKDHENAIKCFQRAVDLDPTYAYGHTLLGHEYYANETIDKALASFRTALRFNARLYNAWYGLGIVYYKQEKWEMAEFHFQHALSLCPYSTILLTFIGMVIIITHAYIYHPIHNS
jgi:anaphase-promoting complex subunit 3